LRPISGTPDKYRAKPLSGICAALFSQKLNIRLLAVTSKAGRIFENLVETRDWPKQTYNDSSQNIMIMHVRLASDFIYHAEHLILDITRVTLRSHSIKWMRSGGIIADDVDYDPTMSPNQENLIVTKFFFYESNLSCDDPM
jgi:hypothetical protein